MVRREERERDTHTHTQRHINKNEDGGREIQKYFSMRACIQTRSDQDEGKKKRILPFRNAKRIGAQTPLSLSFVFGCLFHPSLRPSIHTPALPPFMLLSSPLSHPFSFSPAFRFLPSDLRQRRRIKRVRRANLIGRSGFDFERRTARAYYIMPA